MVILPPESDNFSSRIDHGLSQRVKKICFLRVTWLLRIIRRHFTGVQCVENLLPEFRLLECGNIQRQCFQIDFALPASPNRGSQSNMI